jgi:carbamoyltransferase
MTTKVSEALAKGNIVARYEGGAEFGPRALGHRSILADPTYQRMKDVVNARVKFREAFRPFAPVVPLNSANKVFHLSKPSPYMLLVAPVRDEYKEKLPAITHEDGTGRIQTCTYEKNPFLHTICEKAEEIRGCAPVLMNTSFNVAGQPIVETPEEAIDTFLRTDIDYLAIEGFWIRKSDSSVKDYSEHVAGLEVEPKPKGLPSKQADLKDRMEDLDAAIFQSKVSEFWSEDEIRTLSQKYARYKETSVNFKASSLVAPLKTQFGPNTTLILDPIGPSYLVNETGAKKNRELDGRELQVFLALQCSPKNIIDSLRLVLKASPSELEGLIDEMIKVAESFNVDIVEEWPGYTSASIDSSRFKLEGERTFEVFCDDNVECIPELRSIRRAFLKHGYTEGRICDILAIDSLQSIEPTHLAYYDKYVLAQDPLHDLIRLFQLRCAVPEQRVEHIFSADSLRVLRELKVLIYEGSSVFGGVDIFCSGGFLFATDHRYFILEGDALEEDPVMYIGMDSHGLVQTAPRQTCESLLDLCCGSGIQGIVATRYSRHVTAVDLNPRAVRFARFNASFNGISNYQVRQGSLYEVVAGEKFDCILANPPFVPSPDKSLKFRDGGARGEEILATICKGANSYLKSGGRLCVVTDLVDASNYEKKFASWIGDINAYGLALTTADRDEILFSVPHSHVPFGQTLENYNSELSKWVDNFRNADLSAVNFGYLLIWKRDNISGFDITKRTIHNPSKPMWSDVENWIEQRELWNSDLSNELYIQPHPDLTINEEKTPLDESVKSELSIRNNSFYTSYEVKQDIIGFIRQISRGRLLKELAEFREGKPFLEKLHRLGLLQLTLKPMKKDHSPSKDCLKTDFEISEKITKTTPTCLSSYLS